MNGRPTSLPCPAPLPAARCGHAARVVAACVVALALGTLPACHTLSGHGPGGAPCDVPGGVCPTDGAALPPGGPFAPAYDPACLATGCPVDLPIPYTACATCGPPGLATSWNQGECICDGGDRALGVAVKPDWQVLGLDTQDTVAHYDTLDGRTLVEPSNRVCVYAPRFGAVRSVMRTVENQTADAPRAVDRPETPTPGTHVDTPTTALEQRQLIVATRAALPEAFVRRQAPDILSVRLSPAAFVTGLLPYENLQIIRVGLLDNAEEARLAEAVQAAVAWSGDQMAQVMLDGVRAETATVDQTPQVVYEVYDPHKTPKLRLCKVADSQMAKPGDIVAFTLRFDNVGDQPIGNVVILDNLTPRLEYVPDSAQSSVEAQFSTEVNDAGSLVLRWEVREPLEVGQGGIVRFRCRVR